MRRALVLFLVLGLLAGLASQGFAWGRRGHSLATRNAVSKLPTSMPAFFRNAGERLAYQASEPDRWRGSGTPALTAATAVNHHFDTEIWGDEPIPPTRAQFIEQAVKRGLTAKRPIAELGTGPIGATEMAERLVCDFRYWREGTAETEAERQVLRQLEGNVLYTAGVLAHYVTDLANPMHASYHSDGWVAGIANPNNRPVRPASGLHGRFESTFVQDYITDEEVAKLMTPIRRVGPWIKELEQHTRRSNSHVDEIYAFDAKGKFGSGDEPPEARAFTAARLAEGASMLRDIWYTAWLISEQVWLNEPMAYVGRNGQTVLKQMAEVNMIDPRHHYETVTENGVLRMVRIDNRKNGMDGRQWRLYFNSTLNTTSLDKLMTKAGDRFEFRFEKQ